MKKIILYFPFFISFLICANKAVADETNSPQIKQETMFYNNVGVTASMLSGAGLHYLRHFDEKNAAKLVFMGWSKKDESQEYQFDNESYSFVSLGLEYRYTFIREGKHSAYGLVGGNFWYDEDIQPSGWWRDEVNNLSGVIESTTIENQYSFGFGVGYDYQYSKRIALSVEVGFTRNYTINRNYTYPTGVNRSSSKGFSPSFGIGVGFVF